MYSNTLSLLDVGYMYYNYTDAERFSPLHFSPGFITQRNIRTLMSVYSGLRSLESRIDFNVQGLETFSTIVSPILKSHVL